MVYTAKYSPCQELFLKFPQKFLKDKKIRLSIPDFVVIEMKSKVL